MHRYAIAFLLLAFATRAADAGSRLLVLTDIGNEPDDQMSLVRLLLYSNEIDIEGFIAVTSTWKRDILSPEMIVDVIDAYGEVVPVLRRHADNWPEPDQLRMRVSSGVLGYGLNTMTPDDPSAGAKRIVEAGLRAADRPLWISLWGGANTLAEALAYARGNLSAEDMQRLIGQLRVYSISDQDDAGPWIRRQFPDLFYVVSPSSEDGGDYARATWTGIAGDLFYRNGAGADFTTVSNKWLDGNIRSKGPLGAHYPEYLFIMEGDTPSFLGLIPTGLQSGDHPNWGGWGGRYLLRTPAGESRPVWTQGGDSFTRITSADTVNGHVSDQATIWRWREHFQNDFAARMTWAVASYDDANHPPVVVVNGEKGINPIYVTLGENEMLLLDAMGSSDPDGDILNIRFIHYPEAGFDGEVPTPVFSLDAVAEGKSRITVAARCAKAWFDLRECPDRNSGHIIVAVTDRGQPAITRYRRVVITVTTTRK